MNNAMEKFTVYTVSRNELIGQPYEPIKLSQPTYKVLKKYLIEYGAWYPVFVDEKTNRILSGENKVQAIDCILGHRDYKITVFMVDVRITDKQAIDKMVERSFQSESYISILLSNDELTVDKAFQLDLSFDYNLKDDKEINSI